MTASSPVLLGLAIKLPEVVLAKDQPEYIPLPVLISRAEERMVTARFRLSWKERFRIFVSGNIWIQQLTFQQRFQPTKLSVKQPDVAECL